MTCDAVAGVGTAHRWTVVVNGLSSTPSVATTSYRQPLVTTVSGPGANNANTDGGQVVLVNGREFGPLSSSVAGIYDNLIVVQYGPVVRVADTSVVVTQP